MKHKPVLLSECIENLEIKPEGIYVDGTLGRGGHAYEIARRLHAGKLIAIDRDIDAITESKRKLIDYHSKISFVHGCFSDLCGILDRENVHQADGMLFDFGVSSPQLDESERGFSYMHDAPLDMRMDRDAKLSAYDVVNEWTKEALIDIFKEYGEERYSARIASRIVKKREVTPIKTTYELNEVIYDAMPAAARREPQHPAKRCYQAIRIAVNNELGEISKMLDNIPHKLRVGGRICIISFHSLEDRLVKNAIKSKITGCTCPAKLPICACGFTATMKPITKKPITPTKEEVALNPRARSAKLRVAERIV